MITIQQPTNNKINSLNDVVWGPVDYKYSRDAVLHGSYGLMFRFGRAGLLAFQDRNPSLIEVIADMMYTFDLSDPDAIYWWVEWTLSDPERGFSELQLQEELVKLPWKKQLQPSHI